MAQSQANNERIARNTMMLYIRMFFTMAVSLYTSRVVLAILGAVDYGIYNVVGGVVSMFAFVSGAMTTATQRFLSFEIGKGEDGDVQSMFSTAIAIHLILAGIVLMLAETLGLWFVNTQMNFPDDRLTAVNWVYQFSVLTFAINVVSVPYIAAIVAYERMSTFAYISIVEVVLKLVIVYLLVISPIDKLIFYALLLAIVAIMIRVIYSIYCTRRLPECKSKYRISANNKKDMLSFVSWNLVGSLAGVLKEQGINVLLNVFFGAAINAARGIAYQVLGAVQGFVGNFQMAMNPQIVKCYASGERENMFGIVFRGSRFSFMLLFTISLPIILETPYILQLWLMYVPDYTAIFLRIVLITALVDSLSGTLITSMHASGKVRNYQLVVGGLSLLTLPFAYLLLKIGFEPQYAMIAGFTISTLCLFARLYMLRRMIDFPVWSFIKCVVLRLFPIVIISPLVPFILKRFIGEGLLSFLTICLVAVISSLAFCFLMGLSKSEKIFFVNKAVACSQKLFRQ